ncbi:MAG: hypothetical protein JWO53_791, partial [Chlamydiia bacterium]|nr:hypothetical protein [Chlamydiia bacterium]
MIGNNSYIPQISATIMAEWDQENAQPIIVAATPIISSFITTAIPITTSLLITAISEINQLSACVITDAVNTPSVPPSFSSYSPLPTHEAIATATPLSDITNIFHNRIVSIPSAPVTPVKSFPSYTTLTTDEAVAQAAIISEIGNEALYAPIPNEVACTTPIKSSTTDSALLDEAITPRTRKIQELVRDNSTPEKKYNLESDASNWITLPLTPGAKKAEDVIYMFRKKSTGEVLIGKTEGKMQSRASAYVSSFNNPEKDVGKR